MNEQEKDIERAVADALAEQKETHDLEWKNFFSYLTEEIKKLQDELYPLQAKEALLERALLGDQEAKKIVVENYQAVLRLLNE